MPDVKLREAGSGDVALLIDMMTEFYAESDFPLDPTRARAVFESLGRNPALGRVFLVQDSTKDVGFLVLTLTFSMEYGGLAAFVDDFYVRSECRGRGVGSAALALARRFAEDLGVRAIHLEVGRDNDVAQSVYRRTGFVDNDRQLLTLRLASPTHE